MTLDEKKTENLPEFMTPADCRKFLELGSSRTKLPEGIPFFTTSCLKSDRTRKYVYRTVFLEWFKNLVGMSVTKETDEKCRRHILALLEELKRDFSREGDSLAVDICNIVIQRAGEVKDGRKISVSDKHD